MPPLDPTFQVLLTIFGGALVAAIAGFVGAGIQARREHRRWQRERRYEAFVAAYALTKAFDLNFSKQMKIADAEPEMGVDDPRIQALLTEADALYGTVADRVAPLIILGPDRVAKSYLKMHAAYEAQDMDALGRAEAEFQSNARKALDL
ncbi:hypothetical protein [Microbacterium kunmingense]|uniref:hypothetical protein n=1 Tax=Microbacterium kunmingense TaxID=2915939 RepID=UPI003D75383B